METVQALLQNFLLRVLRFSRDGDNYHTTGCSGDVSLSLSFKRLSFQRTMTGGHTLSTVSLILFEVILSMIVLSAGHHLYQSSLGTVNRVAVKTSVARSDGCCIPVCGSGSSGLSGVLSGWKVR
jgi:hypothetical protein